MQPSLKVVGQAELVAFYGADVPECFAVMFYKGDRPIAVGGVRWDAWGRGWGFFDAKEPVSRFAMHKAARRGLAILGSIGTEVGTACDDTIPNAQRWLRGLGFKPVNGDIWVWRA